MMNAIVRAGATASLTTAAVLYLRGRAEQGSGAGPLNAVSHIVYGDEAMKRDAVSRKYTLTGLALNSAAVTAWAAVHQLLLGRRRFVRRPPRSLLGALAVSALAYGVDSYVVPRRLRPGFERRLSKGSLLAVYAALAVTLSLGARRARRA